jgi:tripartite-type tricarboxylate transporter receptor subunit TctC
MGTRREGDRDHGAVTPRVFISVSEGTAMTRIHSLLLKTAGLMLALTTAVAAQDYPTKTVRIIIPFPPGGFNDIVGRIIAAQLTERLGKQFIVENRSGAGGIVAGELVANAPKDGHTLLIVSLAITVNPWLYKMPYDPLKAFAPVAILATAPNVVSVNQDLPIKSIRELVAMAKAKPGDLKYASSGIGTFMHLGPELFKLMAGVDILHVPFRGAGPALIDVIGGHTQMSFASVPSTMAHVRSGKLRAIGVGGMKRSFAIPDVPTVDESGVPGYQSANWIGLIAPAGTPDAIVARLHKELSALQDTPELQKQFANEGAEVLRMSSAEFGAFIASELAKWGRVVKEAGIKAQ